MLVIQRGAYLTFVILIFGCAHFANAQSIRVMSYNIHHGADKDEVNTLQEMGEFIKNSNVDLVGLQEVDSLCNRSGKIDQMRVLADITGMFYAFQRHFAYDEGSYGSRFPIASQLNVQITSIKNGEKKSLALLSTVVSLPDGMEVKFATVHFALDQSTRLIQARETLSILESNLPVILTGDFNAEPNTEEMDLLSSGFNMTDATQGRRTFPAENPSKKIDYIWLGKSCQTQNLNFQIPLNATYSDHLPLVVSLTLDCRE
ncbi:endonuclease/exonuclease/phosphatase family protein [Algoriphagus aestuarii]|nr:endonuclease/exonuclease/phosphatase family protein [Algoriphagus aestuarii]